MGNKRLIAFERAQPTNDQTPPPPPTPHQKIIFVFDDIWGKKKTLRTSLIDKSSDSF